MDWRSLTCVFVCSVVVVLLFEGEKEFDLSYFLFRRKGCDFMFRERDIRRVGVTKSAENIGIKNSIAKCFPGTILLAYNVGNSFLKKGRL